jgi:hypothetical protein
MNRTYQFLVYADDVILLGENINSVNNNTETVLDTNKDGLQVNTRMQEKIIT